MKRSQAIAVGVVALSLVGVGAWLHRSAPAAPVRPIAAPAHATPSDPPTPARNAAGEPAARRPPVATSAVTHAAWPIAAPEAGSLALDLADPDPRVRVAAVRELARSSAPDLAALLAASRDSDREVGVAAMGALGRAYAEGKVPAAEMIARAKDRSVDERVRSLALNGLGQVENEETARVLADLLMRGDPRERRSAAALLAHQDTAIAAPALIDALDDADVYVRSQALASLKARSRGRDFGTDATAWRAFWRAPAR